MSVVRLPQVLRAQAGGERAIEVDAATVGAAVQELVGRHPSLEGQLLGGFAHGLGYALFESTVYDPDGALRTPSFLDYTIVSVGEVTATPELVHIETPTDSNPEGFKGAGESGTIPVPAAISSAIEDAIRQVRPEAVVDRIPMSPDRVFELLG